MEYDAGFKKEGNSAICDYTNEPEEPYAM